MNIQGNTMPEHFFVKSVTRLKKIRQVKKIKQGTSALVCVTGFMLGAVSGCSELQEVIVPPEDSGSPGGGEKNPADAVAGNNAVNSIFASLPDPMPAVALNPAPKIREIRAARSALQITPTPRFFAGSQESLRAAAGDRICFTRNQTGLDARSQAILQRVAIWLKANPGRGLILQGHSSARATREYSVGVSEHRTNLVGTYLQQSGVAKNKLRTHALGRERKNVLCRGDLTAVYLIPVRS